MVRVMEKIIGTRIDAQLATTLVTLAVSFVVAEQLYKFHSFTLETGAFLATWYVIRRAALLLTRRTG